MVKQLYFILLLIALIVSPATAAYQTAILTWNPPTDTVTVGYHVFRGSLDCTASGPLQPLTDVNGQPVTTGLVTTYTDNTVPDVTGTICYEITANDANGQQSSPSNRVSKSVIGSTPLPPTPPSTPTGLTVTIQ